MVKISNQPSDQNPPSLFVGSIAQSTSISPAAMGDNQASNTLSQSDWTSSRSTFFKYYLIPSLLFSMPGHIAVLGAVLEDYELERSGVDLWFASPVIAIITLAIILIFGIIKKNKSILYAVLAGFITDIVVWVLSVYYYAYFSYGGW